jgi:GntR family L-lactate dehydrogenase operon transcriptional regulator
MRVKRFVLISAAALAATGGAPDAGVEFHALVARAGRNRVLAAAIDLLRRETQRAVLLDALPRRTAHRWVAGHEAILAAIKRRAPDEAERAMIEHINGVIADVERAHGRARRGSAAGA